MELLSKTRKYEKTLYMPMKIVAVYLFATVFFYFFGPIKWNIDNPITLFGYLLISYLMLIAGYNRYMNKQRRYSVFSNENDEETDDAFPYYGKLFTLLLIFTIISHMSFSYFEYGGIHLNRILNMAQSYLDNREYEATHNIVTRLCTYLWGLNYFYLPCGIVLFKRLKLLDKVLFFVALGTNVFFWLSIGTMKGLGDIIITAMIPLIIVTVKGRRNLREIKRALEKRKWLIMIFVVIFVIVFGYSALNRSLLRGNTTYSALNRQLRPFTTREDLWPFPYITNSIIVYVSHGYTGLAYALKLPFKWTFMVGNSRALTSLVERKILGTTGAISSLTYVQRLEDVYGWANGSIWPSAFTWLASDFTFIFLPVLLYLLGKFWAKCIYEALIDNNIVSLVMASYLTIFFIYLPCNNQIVQAERSFWALVLIGIMYFLNTTRRPLSIGGRILRL